ncbi:hypothetical protein ACWCPF_26025 [Streptomyces sp. NPDC001858]
MATLIAVDRNGIQHVLIANATDAPCPDPDCTVDNLVTTEIVHADQTAEINYDGCGHEYLTATPTLGETLQNSRSAR